MTSTRKTMPERSPWGAMVPTLNHRGFMAEELDECSAAFAAAAASVSAPVLDIGCAYGVATLAALDAGATVVACDMEAEHLEVLEGRVSAEQAGRLTTQQGLLPVVDFEPNSFAAILCSRALHFLRGEEVVEAIGKMAAWLQPGGQVFLVVDTPYTGFWRSTAPEYERRRAAGDPWPGMIDDIRPLLSGDLPEDMLPYLNPMDAQVLERECLAAGLEIVRAWNFDGDPATPRHGGVIARRPA